MDIASDLPIGRIRGLRACASPRGTFGVLGARSSPEPAQGAPAGRPGVGELCRARRVQAGGGPRAGTGRDRRAARSRDRGGAGGRRRLAPGRQPGCSWRSRRPAMTARPPPGSAGSSTAGAWPRRSGWGRRPPSCSSTTTPTRPMPPTRSGSSRPSPATAGRADLALFVEPLSFSIDRPCEAHGRGLGAGSSSRPPGDSPRWAGTSSRRSSRTTRASTDEGAWRDACAELEAATRVPWVLLSGGVDDATFERQVRVACEAGASGVLVGRSVWAEAATLAGADRDRFLRTDRSPAAGPAGRPRRRARGAWTPGRSARPGPEPGDGWYRGYAE